MRKVNKYFDEVLDDNEENLLTQVGQESPVLQGRVSLDVLKTYIEDQSDEKNI